MHKLIIAIGILGLSVSAWAKPLSQAEFKAQTKQKYDELELKLAVLNSSVDRREHPALMIAKACEYATGLKQLKYLSEQNLHLATAQDEFRFVSTLDNQFTQSLQDLGTTYEPGCVSQKK